MTDPLLRVEDGIPIIDITQLDYWQDPYVTLAKARAMSRVYRATPMLNPAFLRFADVEALLLDDRLGSPRTQSLEVQGITSGPLHEWWRNGMLFNDPPVHTRLRKLVARAFTPRQVERMRPVTAQICHELLDELVPRGGFEFVGDFAHHVPIRVITELLGVPQDDYQSFAVETAALSAAFSAIIPPEARERVERAILWLYDYADGLIELKRREPAEDLLTALIEAEESGDRLSVDELKAMIVGLLFAGHDTTKSLLTIGIKTLIDHPDAYRALRADPGLAEPVVEEILRYQCPVGGTIRRASEGFRFADFDVQEGDLVFLSFLSAHRDEQHYPEPDRFDIERADKRHLAFGLGRHFCVGNSLGRLEGQEGLRVLTERLAEPRLVDAEPRWVPFAGIRRFEKLPIAFST